MNLDLSHSPAKIYDTAGYIADQGLKPKFNVEDGKKKRVCCLGNPAIQRRNPVQICVYLMIKDNSGYSSFIKRFRMVLVDD